MVRRNLKEASGKWKYMCDLEDVTSVDKIRGGTVPLRVKVGSTAPHNSLSAFHLYHIVPVIHPGVADLLGNEIGDATKGRKKSS